MPIGLVSLAAALVLQPATTVTFAVSGLPEGQFPPLTVQAPGGATTRVGSLDELRALRFDAPGEYRLTGPAFRAPSGWVDTIYEAAAPAVRTVAAGQTAAVELAYRPRGGTGMLWIAAVRTDDEDDFSQGNVRAFRGTALAAGEFAPTRVIGTGPRNHSGIVLRDGTFLFADSWDQDRVMRLGVAALAAGGAPTPAGGFEHGFVALDPSGRVWSSRETYARAYRPGAGGALGDALLELTRDEDAGADAPNFGSMLFRGDGSAIVQRTAGLAVLPAAVLSRSGVVRPNWRETPDGTDGQGAVDAEGHLWVANENGAVHRFDRAELDGDGPLSPREFPVEQGVCSVAVDAEGGVLALVKTGRLYRLAPGGSAFEFVGSLGTGFDQHSRLVLNPPAVGTPLAAGFPDRLTAPQ